MASETSSPKRESTPTMIPSSSSIPQKRALLETDAHSPAVSSPLNPVQQNNQKVTEDSQQTMAQREKRTKKESLKKRESKGVTGTSDSARASPAPKQPKENPAEMAPLRYKLAPPKPTDFEVSRGPVFTPHHEVVDTEGRTLEFFETSDHVYNKKNFHYNHCIADPAFPSMFYYRNTEAPPFGTHLSFEDTASHMYFNRLGTHVSTDKGFRMCRANVAVREGRWYWECKVTRGILSSPSSSSNEESHGHIRLGFARREASLDAPVGFDAYSYGIRDVSGQKVHMSRPKDFFPPGEDIKEGDVIGLEINLPSERLHRKVVTGQYNPAVDLLDEDQHTETEAPNIIRDRIPIRFKAHIYFEKIDYHTTKELEELMNPSPVSGTAASNAEKPNPNHSVPALRTLPNSWIKVYKNGNLMGTAWKDLLAFLPPASKMVQQPGGREALDDGSVGYYPAVSVFRGGAVETNFGPEFWFPPPGLTSPQSGGDIEMEDAPAPQTNGNGTTGPEQKLLRPVNERYDEQIVEDIVYDIVDEVGFWAQQGFGVMRDGRAGGDGSLAGLLLAAGGGREEIKELVQDD
ncbi:hypothetical protein QBC35DRAFT_150059 [Podospora australis]|uniref:B30.2/SPRY domain-containing protein n=1 Tax=Podospora australis TaxID=1536484 RepID=A0AAN6WX74_9PEZI|nr:hypothetical protein QBC35DRAFT_150059 [Podospora australis]